MFQSQRNIGTPVTANDFSRPEESGDKGLTPQTSVRRIVMRQTQNTVRLHVGILNPANPVAEKIGMCWTKKDPKWFRMVQNHAMLS